jgi:Flp pilus assembly protein TadG
MTTTRFRKRSKSERRGAVTVEFAVVAPVFLVLLLGLSEASHLIETQSMMESAAREGARLAAMDRQDLEYSKNQSTNQKISSDVLNILSSCGLPKNKIKVSITEVDDSSQQFDLDDPANDLRLFQLQVELPYSDINKFEVPGAEKYTLGARVVFRNSRAAKN